MLAQGKESNEEMSEKNWLSENGAESTQSSDEIGDVWSSLFTDEEPDQDVDEDANQGDEADDESQVDDQETDDVDLDEEDTEDNEDDEEVTQTLAATQPLELDEGFSSEADLLTATAVDQAENTADPTDTTEDRAELQDDTEYVPIARYTPTPPASWPDHYTRFQVLQAEVVLLIEFLLTEEKLSGVVVAALIAMAGLGFAVEHYLQQPQVAIVSTDNPSHISSGSVSGGSDFLAPGVITQPQPVMSGATQPRELSPAGLPDSITIESNDWLYKHCRKVLEGWTQQQDVERWISPDCVQPLEQANSIPNPDKVYPGQVFVFPSRYKQRVYDQLKGQILSK